MNTVNITDDASNQRMKIPVDDDKSLPLQTLQRYFSGAIGLFYLGEGEEKIAVRFDESMTKLVPPTEGWEGKMFFIFRPKVPSLAGSSVDAQSDSAYSRGSGSSATMSKSIEKWMFFARDDAGKSCVICVHPHYFVTFRHGPHLQLRVGEQLPIHKEKPDLAAGESFLVTVVHIDEMHDFILLKSEAQVVEKGPLLEEPRDSEGFLLADYGKEQQNLSYQSGVVRRDVKIHFFRGEDNNPTGSHVRGPFVFGTGLRSAGDSGGACWSRRGLLGIKLGCTSMPTAPHDSTISDAAVYSSKIYMTSAAFLSKALKRELNKDPKPSHPKKGVEHLVYFEGIGTAELRCDDSD